MYIHILENRQLLNAPPSAPWFRAFGIMSDFSVSFNGPLSIDLCSQGTNVYVVDGSHISVFLRLSGFISGGLETSPPRGILEVNKQERSGSWLFVQLKYYSERLSYCLIVSLLLY